MQPPDIHQEGDSLVITLGPGGLFAGRNGFGGAALLAVMVVVLGRVAVVERPGAVGPIVFVGVLACAAVVCVARGIAAATRADRITAAGGSLTLTQTRYWRSRSLAWHRDDDLLTVCVVPADDSQESRAAEMLAVVDRFGGSQTLLRDLAHDELRRIAVRINTHLDLPLKDDPVQPSAEVAAVAAGQRVVDQHLGEMQEAVEQMRAEIESAEASPEPDRSTRAPATARPEIEARRAELGECERRLAEARARRITLDFPLIQFDPWKPGERVCLRREELDGRAARRAAIAHSLGSMILIAMLAPIAVPLVGFVISLVAHIWPGDRMRLYLTIVDLFRFGPLLAVWIPILWGAWIVAVWLRLEAAFAPHEVDIDWRQKRLSLRTRAGTRTEPLGSVECLVAYPCAPPSETPDSVVPETLPIRICLRLRDGRELPLLEAGPDDEIEGLDEGQTLPIERIAPVLARLAEALRVPQTLGEVQYDAYDLVGFRRDHRWRDWRRTWRMAGRPSRRAALVLLFGTITFVLLRGIYTYVTLGPTE